MRLPTSGPVAHGKPECHEHSAHSGLVAGWESAFQRNPLPHRLSASTLAAVSSLWTPGGEHKVPRPDEPSGGSGGPREPRSGSPSGGPPSPPAGGGMPERPEGPDDGEPTEQELRELARQLAAAPPEDVIANHCYGLFELGALHLSQQPANVPAARLAFAGGINHRVYRSTNETHNAHFDSHIDCIYCYHNTTFVGGCDHLSPGASHNQIL